MVRRSGRPERGPWKQGPRFFNFGSGLLLAQSLSILLFAACLWWIAREVEFVITNDRITSSLSVQRALGSTLGRQLATFAAAALFVHMLFGLLVYGLARLTEAAFPGDLRARQPLLITFWFVLLAGLAMAANTTLFPSSLFAGEESWWRGEWAGLPYVAIAALALAMLCGLLLARAARRSAWKLRLPRRIGYVPAAAAALLLLVLLPSLPASKARAASARPNIVILGIDSLRNDLLIPRRGNADVPNLRAFIHGARRFKDATTPLARTYASWITILTGRHPVTTNARYNLMPRRLVNERETLGDALRAHGYRAIYATDEVRFANIDRSFGFDETITPPVGAVDFLLGYAGDMPLVNLVASTPAGSVLFPSNHANRAAQVTYRPRDFVSRLENEVDIQGPTFLAVHLTLAHWPYAWAGKRVPTVPEDYRTAYGDAVHEVDRQFGDVLKLLADKGVLDNAIVVVLSDHGEALGAQNDSIIRETATSREVWDSLWGHGTSVLSPNQFQVLLAMRAFGHAKLPGPERNYGWPVSLEDLRPTLEQLATGEAPAGVDGTSLVPYLSDPPSAGALAARIRFTETDFNTTKVLAGRYEASGLVDEAASYYELDPDSGWVQLRAPQLPELIAQKQRAAISANAFLAAIPAGNGGEGRYLYAERQDPRPRVLAGPEAASRDPEAGRLAEALEERFPGELEPHPGVPRM